MGIILLIEGIIIYLNSKPILNYIQTGKLVINDDKYNLDEIKKEFKFYDISFSKNNNKLPH